MLEEATSGFSGWWEMFGKNMQSVENCVIWVLQKLNTDVIRIQLPIFPTNDEMNMFKYFNRLQVKSYGYNWSHKRNKKQLTCGKDANELSSADR